VRVDRCGHPWLVKSDWFWQTRTLENINPGFETCLLTNAACGATPRETHGALVGGSGGFRDAAGVGGGGTR
jgi:hypothetical protein